LDTQGVKSEQRRYVLGTELFWLQSSAVTAAREGDLPEDGDPHPLFARRAAKRPRATPPCREASKSLRNPCLRVGSTLGRFARGIPATYTY